MNGEGGKENALNQAGEDLHCYTLHRLNLNFFKSLKLRSEQRLK
jgi:hypothetical protein